VKMLKISMFLHETIMMFSIGMTLVMLMETTDNIYPDVFCYICAFISLTNVLYSAYMSVYYNNEIKRIKTKERR